MTYLLLLIDGNDVVKCDAQAEMGKLLQHTYCALVDLRCVCNRRCKHFIRIDEGLRDCIRLEHLTEGRTSGVNVDKCLQKMFCDGGGGSTSYRTSS